MAERKLPPSFGGFVMDADHGRIERILSVDLGRIMETITDKSNLHEQEWGAEFTLKIKIKAEPNGKVTSKFSRSVKIDEEKLPTARMYYDPEDGSLSNDVPRQVKIPGFDDGGRPRAKAKSAPAPTVAGEKKDEEV
jgi:hypothetical protein